MASKSERTKAFIIEKTSPIFNRKGVAGTSISDMTEATGLTKGAIYGNFSDKDEVALAAFTYNVDKVFNDLAMLLSHEDTAISKLKAINNYYRKKYVNGGFDVGGCPMANTATEVDDTHPLLHAKVKERYLKWRKGIKKIVEAGITSGELREDLDVEGFANIMITTLQGCVVVTKATGDSNFLTVPLANLDSQIDSFRK